MKNQILSVIVVVILVVGAFFLGSMKTKIDYLEGRTVAGGANQNNPPSQTPSQAGPERPTEVKAIVNQNDPIKGDPNAKVTVVEYSDFQCPFCGRFHTDTWPQIQKEYVDTGKVKFVYKNLAFLGQESNDSANAAFCAQEQNRFWEYHDKLFASQNGENEGAFSKDNLKRFALDVGLDAGKFNACLDANRYDSRVQADISEANQNGFNSTPSFAINSVPLIGAQPFSKFKTIIDAELAKN